MSDPSMIGLAVAGWLATTWFAYRWGLRSQKIQREYAAKGAARARKMDFLAFMQAWRVEIDRRDLEPGGFGHHDPAAFADNLAGFRAVAEPLRGDLGGDAKRKFDSLIAAVCGCNPNKHQQITQAIDNLIAYIETE